MADQRHVAPVSAPAQPVAAKPAVALAPSQNVHPRRNPGWCLADNLAPGQTSQDMTVQERKASAMAHEAKWKRRYGTQGVVENPWTRG